MNILRKSIGLLIIIFIGIPVLLGVIWTVGVTKAVVSPEFLSDLPREIIERIPEMVDEVLEEIDREDMIDEPNSREWVRAIVDAHKSPKELLSDIGILDWLENELSVSLKRMGDMLRGEIPPQPIVLDLRPLKKALRHEAITAYLIDVLKNLPRCEEDQMRDWQDAAMDRGYIQDLPACQPEDLESAAKVLQFARDHEIDEIPDEVDLIDDVTFLPEGINLAKTVVRLTYFLFLIPALFIFVAAMIGATGKSGILKWVGLSTMVSAILVYAITFLVSNTIPWAMGIAHEGYVVSAFEKLMTLKVGSLGMMVMKQILSGVNSVAGVVFIVGIIFFALSFLLANDTAEEQVQEDEETSQPERQVKEVETSDSAEKKEEE